MYVLIIIVVVIFIILYFDHRFYKIQKILEDIAGFLEESTQSNNKMSEKESNKKRTL